MPNTTINHLKPEEIIRFSDGTINSESSNKELHPLIVFEVLMVQVKHHYHK